MSICFVALAAGVPAAQPYKNRYGENTMLKSALERDQVARPFETVIRQFGEMVKNEPGLLEKLSATPDKDSFIDLYIRLAEERGCHFNREDLLVVVQEQKQGSNWVIPKPVLLLIAERF